MKNAIIILFSSVSLRCLKVTGLRIIQGCKNNMTIKQCLPKKWECNEMWLMYVNTFFFYRLTVLLILLKYQLCSTVHYMFEGLLSNFSICWYFYFFQTRQHSTLLVKSQCSCLIIRQLIGISVHALQSWVSFMYLCIRCLDIMRKFDIFSYWWGKGWRAEDKREVPR